MNQGIFRLVFSKVLNMYVPASEAVKSKTCKSNGRKARKLAHKVMFLVLVTTTPTAWAAEPAGLNLQSAVGAALDAARTNATTMTIQQNTSKAILDWNQLNLNKGELLKFDQQGNRSWSALNRIHDAAPSMINGNVQADGNVYFINTNGIIFGKDSQVNVGTLYASSLDITNELFNSGLLSNPNAAIFSGTGGFITVQEGAQIFAATGGRVLLLAPTVTNNGLISTPDGQTILAAGNKVYLQALTASDVTGNGRFLGEDAAHLLVEVDSGGSATNLGKIIADRGNVTLVGLAVNQQGVISASTSVRANGSIKLLARSDTNILASDAASNKPVPILTTQGGKVTLDKGSVTEVRVEMDDKEEITGAQTDAKPFLKSKVIIAGSDIDVEGKIIAKGGNVSIANPPSIGGLQNPVTTKRVYLGSDSLIDVSGVDAIAPMSRNQLEIQLYSDQLKDVPLLRDTSLYKQTVYVDARKGTSLTDITPFTKLKGKTVAELMTAGGIVSMGGEVIQRAGSTVNVSGGTTTYLPGAIKETVLNYNGKLIPISEIDATTTVPTLADTYSVKDAKWGVTRTWDMSGGSTVGWGRSQAAPSAYTSVVGSQQAGYKVGADAGEINNADSNAAAGTVLSAFTVMDGTVLANTYIGDTQRALQQTPKGGTIALTGDFVASREQLSSDFNFDTPLNQSGLNKFNVDFLKNGFNNVRLTGEVNTALNVNPNGVVRVDGLVNSNVIAAGSHITISGAIADGVTISSAGLFTNDSRGVIGALTQPVAINAGSIDATMVGKNVTLDASAGAWQDSTGLLHKGKAGNIALQVTDKVAGEGSQLKAYGFDKGGELTITTPNNVNVAGTPNVDDLYLSADFFSQGGFSKYNVKSEGGGDVTIGDGSVTDIYTNMQTLRLNSDYANLASGSSVLLAATPWLAPEYQRQASSLSFSAFKGASATGNLTLNENATIRTDVGGKVTLEATKHLALLGDITTPAGEINVKVSGGLNNVLYDSTSGIFIGENAKLNAAGVYRQLPSNTGLIQSEIINGGNINVSTKLGALVTKDGSVLDVSAASGLSDTKLSTGYQRETLYGDAGGVSLTARDGMLLDGNLKGSAAGTGRGGNLTLTLSDTAQSGDAVTDPFVGADFKITQSKVLTVQGLKAGDAVLPPAGTDAGITGQAQISVAQMQQGGFDNVSIVNNFGKQIAFDAGVNLSTPGTLTLQAPMLSVTGNNGNATISASYVALKQGSGATATSADIALGSNSLNINANQINFDHQVAVTNVNLTSLSSKLDINGAGDSTTAGGLVAPGNIVLAARNIYPNTGNGLAFEAVGSDSKITVNKSATPAKAVLSAQGELTLKADYIEQNGNLKAPFGVINLEATKKLTLGDGSLTSASGEGQLIPYSTTQLSGQQYQTEKYQGVDYSANPKLTAKAVNLKSGTIEQKAGSKVDLSGGGDMFAYEWIPGIGGSKDILSEPGYYAVMASVGKDYAAVDSVYQGSSASVNVGDAVYLTGITGLASGTYTLLPARYALMPGAFLVKAGVKSTLLPNQTAQQVDGSMLTTGYRESLGTGAHDATWSTFQVVSGDILRPAAGTVSKSPSEYLITSASDYFTKQMTTNGLQQQLPQDAGQLALVASSQLILAGDIIANKVVGAHGAMVDIASENIRVVSDTGAEDGSLQLKASDLNKLNAESVLLGGRRTVTSTNTSISTTAKTVSVENDAANAILAPEFMAVANDSITVKSGAVVNTGAPATKSTQSNIQTAGDGAFVAASSINDITYNRIGAGGSAGTLTVETGATISAGKSVVLDSTKDAAVTGVVKVADGGSATFGANRIVLGTAPSGTQGLNVSDSIIKSLGNLAKFAMNSYHNIDVFGDVKLGSDKLDLTINAAGIAGQLNANKTVEITAHNLNIKNSSGATYAVGAADTGSKLNITAAHVTLQGKEAVDNSITKGNVTLGGFSEINVNTNELRVGKTGSTTFDAAQTNLKTGRITADTGADFTLKSNAGLTTTKLVTPITNVTSAAALEGIGAKLAVEASNLTVGGNIEMAAGNITLTSKTANLNVVSGANVNAKSTEVAYYDKTVATQAGNVSLVSALGDVNVNAGAVVDVSSLNGANAGTVKVSAISAGKTTSIEGSLKGTAGADAKGKTGAGASLVIDVDKLADLTSTNKNSTGFSESRDYRVRNDNVVISGAGTNSLKAKQVSVTADNGSITVAGDIDASSAKDGAISLFAKNNLKLESTAKLLASSSDAGAQGGTVKLHTTAGNLDLQTGSKIDVTGGANGAGGEVKMRVARTGMTAAKPSGTGVAVTALNAEVQGASSVVLEATRTFNNITTLTTGAGSGATDTLGYTTIDNDVTSFMANKAGVVSALGGIASNDNFHLLAGVEVQSTNNLTVASDWNLYSNNRAGNEPGVLTLRAKNNIVLNGSLSDGFADASSSLVTVKGTPEVPAIYDDEGNEISPAIPGVKDQIVSGLKGGDSWSYRIAAGADLASANALNTIAVTTKDASGNATTGNVTLANNKVIRTGTGDIEIATGGDLKMLGANAAIYTVGVAAPNLAGFTAPDATALYLTGGGSISIATQGNVVGAEPLSGRQLINNWLFRQGGGTNDLDTTWWARPDLFKQSLATFGGGDVHISAGGNISNFSASLPTTARYDTNASPKNSTVQSRIDGGGDLTIKAGGDINNGVYFVAKGEGNISVGGSIQKSGATLGTVLALQDGTFNVSAVKNTFIETVVNPTMLAQSTVNNSRSISDATGLSAFFNSYSDNAKLNLVSLTGNAEFGDAAKFTGSTIGGLNTTPIDGRTYYPATVNAAAFAGDIKMPKATLVPSANGNLNLLAANNVVVGNVQMSDADPLIFPNALNPVKALTADLISTHALTPLHTNDAVSAMIVAKGGSVIGNTGLATDKLDIAKTTKIVAGKDVIGLVAEIQNVRAGDVTLIKAGNDITGDPSITVAGPGEVLVEAGRNVDLGKGDGINTIAKTNNSALPKEGASITVGAGLGKDSTTVDSYIAQYIAPTGSGPAVLKDDATKLAEYHANTTKAVTAYMRKVQANSNLTDAQALVAFNEMSLESKAIFAYRHLSSELLASGESFAKTQNNMRGDNAIAALFPKMDVLGNLTLFNSKISTSSDGSIDILVPHGLVNAGLAGGGSKTDIGIITQQGGAIRAFSDAGFEVNTSKVITQYGSDITVWVNNGDIDAGRGSKTATSVPERRITTDVDGNTIVENLGVAAGSGIRAQSYDPDGNGPLAAPVKGKVALIAPRGKLDAGEAGIEAGDFLAVATQVIGADNISVSGASQGVPAVAAAGIAGASAGLSPDATNSAVQAVANSVAQAASQPMVKPTFPSLITGEVIGLGD